MNKYLGIALIILVVVVGILMVNANKQHYKDIGNQGQYDECVDIQTSVYHTSYVEATAYCNYQTGK